MYHNFAEPSKRGQLDVLESFKMRFNLKHILKWTNGIAFNRVLVSIRLWLVGAIRGQAFKRLAFNNRAEVTTQRRYI